MLSQIFTWWNSSTWGTSLTLWKRKARLVGRDEQGNRYYEERQPSSSDGRLRRWVVYHGVAEASRVTPDWHGWLHHTFEEAPVESPLLRRKFEKDHLPNMTGTPLAYHPKGSLVRVSGDKSSSKSAPGQTYEAWTPEDA